MFAAYDEAASRTRLTTKERLAFCAGFRQGWAAARETYEPIRAREDPA